jgi:carnitine-CoA ligase
MDPAQLAPFQMHGQDIPSLLAHWADRTPDRAVLTWEPRAGEGRRWTYAELLHDTRRLAAGLVARGITPGDKVLIHADNCPEMVLAWLACATVGAVGVTTNTRSVAAEVAYFVEKARCVAAITQPQYAALVSEAAGNMKWVAVTEDNSGEPPAPGEAGDGHDRFGDLFGDAGDWPGRPVEPMLPYCIMFTSGTTSKPKAVVHTHANAIWASRTGPRNIDLGPSDTYLIFLPFFHTNAQTWSFFSVLGAGAGAVLMPKWSTTRFWDVVARHGVTHTSTMGFLLPMLAAPDKPKTSLRVAVFGHVLPDLERASGIGIYAAYGMTETVTHSITAKPVEQLPARSMGHVTPGYEIAVADKETGELCAEGETGELWLRGTRGIQLMLEYFDDPAANAKAFEDGWFKTGDMVKMGAGGNVYYQERDKDVLKVGGENVSAKEVEEVALTVPGVAQVAVVGKHHEFLDQVPVAFVITRDGAPGDEELGRQVIAACAQQLADFKVPRAVYVVDAFPTGTLDKILKNRLRDMADEHPPV